MTLDVLDSFIQIANFDDPYFCAAWRHAAQITQKDISYTSGLPTSMLSMFERGDRISRESMRTVCGAYEKSIRLWFSKHGAEERMKVIIKTIMEYLESPSYYLKRQEYKSDLYSLWLNYTKQVVALHMPLKERAL